MHVPLDSPEKTRARGGPGQAKPDQGQAWARCLDPVRSLLVMLFVGCSSGNVSHPLQEAPLAAATSSATPTPTEVSAEVPKPLACLARHYDATARHDDAGWSLVAQSGESIPYAQAVEVYEPKYPTGPIRPVVDVDFDPGRVRLDPLLFSTYGKNAKEVESALTRVVIGHKTVLVHRKIAEPLRRVAARIDAAMKLDSSLAGFFESMGGTFNWRVIAGTTELSMHAWGIAIDLDTSRSNYWRNERPPLTWKNRYPQAIVDAFEREGFVWGGRWYHYDTMHFEYRPELLDPDCYP
jgi:hypothetical protein